MHRSFWSLLLAVLGALSAVADPVYDSGAPDLREGSEITRWREANRFTLDTATVLGGIRFWDVEVRPMFADSVVWEIRANSASNTPGNVLAHGNSLNLSHTATGRNAFVIYPEFVNTFDISAVSLPPGTYWLVLHNGPLSNSGTQNIFWETAANPLTDQSFSDDRPFLNNWDANGLLTKLAFQLNGPENLVPRIVATDFQNSVPRITFTTAAGQRYRLEYKTSLNDPAWLPVANAENIMGTGTPVQVSDPEANARSLPHRFYRAALQTAVPSAAEASVVPPAPFAKPAGRRLESPANSLSGAVRALQSAER